MEGPFGYSAEVARQENWPRALEKLPFLFGGMRREHWAFPGRGDNNFLFRLSIGRLFPAGNADGGIFRAPPIQNILSGNGRCRNCIAFEDWSPCPSLPAGFLLLLRPGQAGTQNTACEALRTQDREI